MLDTAFLKTALSVYPVPKHIAQDMELCHQPARQHGQSVGAYEERDHQQPHAVADGIHKEDEQTEEAENGGGDAEDAAGQADDEHEKPCDNGKRRKDGRKEDFQKESHINIPPVSFVSAFSIQEAALPCKDAGPQKKQGRLTSQQAAPHGINTPLFDGGKAGQDTACRLPNPLLILEYILHVCGVNAPCFMHPPRELIEVVGGIPQQRHQLPQLRQVELHHIAVNGHFPKICAHVRCAELRHLRLDHRPFLRRHADFELDVTFPLRHVTAPYPSSLRQAASAPPKPVAAWSGRRDAGGSGCGPRPCQSGQTRPCGL